MPRIKIILITGLLTAGAILLYEFINTLFIYKYFRFEYYLAIVALAALATGIVITKRAAAGKNNAPGNNSLYCLTNKELQILQLISQGKTNKEIAADNYVEVSTVKTHINNINSKLGTKNRKQAAEIYRDQLKNNKSTFSPPAVI